MRSKERRDFQKEYGAGRLQERRQPVALGANDRSASTVGRRESLQPNQGRQEVGYPYEDFDDMIRVLTALTCELLYEAPPGSRRSGEPAIQPVDVVYDPL